jgi:hypothetical protein
MKIFALKSALTTSFITVPSLTISIRWFYLLAQPETSINIGTIAFTIVSFVFAGMVIILKPHDMLLGNATIPVLLCCFGPLWNPMAVSVLALIILLSSCSFKKLQYRSQTLLQSTLKFQLVFLFALDAFAPSISNVFLFALSFLMTLVPLSSPEPEFTINNIEANDFLLKALDKINSEKKLTKT